MVDVIPDGEKRGIACPKCKSTDTSVIRTRRLSGWIRRERRCNLCQHKWHTKEQNVTSSNLRVVTA